MLPRLPPVADELEFAGRSMLDLLEEDHHLIGQLCTRLADLALLTLTRTGTEMAINLHDVIRDYEVPPVSRSLLIMV